MREQTWRRTKTERASGSRSGGVRERQQTGRRPGTVV